MEEELLDALSRVEGLDVGSTILRQPVDSVGAYSKEDKQTKGFSRKSKTLLLQTTRC